VLLMADLDPGTMRARMGFLHGQLLVASPAMADPNFARSVIAIANHDEDGALGIILNRPSETEVVEAVPELEGVIDDDEVVFVGGPVQPASIVVLAEFEDPAEAAFLVVDGIGLVSDRTGLDRLGVATARRRVFAGYAGWGPGQLEQELEREDWILEAVQPQDVFDEEPGALWGRVLARKGGQFRLLARMPLDPSVN
jgi:putative transcriptional regulator